MKQLIGVAINIHHSLLGKITFKNSLFTRKTNLIFVSKNGIIPEGFAAVLTSYDIFSQTNQAVVKSVNSLETLNENDIVTIDSNGTINVVYEIDSKHNSIFVTERCNSNCIMCPQPPVQEDEDRFEQNLKLIKLIDKKTTSIGITGGEPTLLKEKLITLISEVHRNLPKASINILSNGIRFENYEYAKQFAKTLKKNDVVDIPLYSDIDSIHNSIVRSKSFYKTINGIYNLAKFNVKIGLRIVVHKMNYERLPEFSEFIYTNFPFLFHIAFMQMEPIGNAQENINQLWIDPSDYNKELECAILNLSYRDLNVSIFNSQLCILPERLRPFAVQSISEWKNIYIDECEKCIQKNMCPGFFASSRKFHSQNILAINDLQAKEA